MESPKRILIVDDSADIRETYALALPPPDYEVKSTATREEALTLIQDWKPHLIFSDIRMPGMELSDFIDALQKHLPQSKIVVLSNFSPNATQVKEANLSVTYHQKPSSLLELQELIQTYL